MKRILIHIEFSSSYTKPSTTLYTCSSIYTSKSLLIQSRTISAAIIIVSSSLGAIVAAVVIISIIICILIITIPLCICCCLGVGIGAAFNSGRRQRATVVTTQPNAVVVSSDTNMQQVPPPSYEYAPTPATGYTKPDVYPPPAQI